MLELKVGTRVLVVQDDGRSAFEDVFVFGHADPDVSAVFVQLKLESGRKLSLSPDHFMPIVPSGHTSTITVRSSSVAVGDMAFVWSEVQATTMPELVVEVSNVTKKGLYNPYTASGTIVVDDVVASVHSRWFLDDFFDAMLPVRAIYTILKNIGGPELTRSVDQRFMLSQLGHRYPKGFVVASCLSPAFLVVFAGTGLVRYRKSL